MSLFGSSKPAVDPQEQVNEMMEKAQARDAIRMYNSLVERCFEDCVSSFRTRSLDSKEELCIYRCTDKFVQHSQRVGQRFAEQSATMAGQGMMPGQ